MSEREPYNWRVHFNMGRRNANMPEIDLGPKSKRNYSSNKRDFNETIDPYDFVAGQLLEGDAISLNNLILDLGEDNLTTRRRLDQLFSRVESSFPDARLETFTVDFEKEDGTLHTEDMVQLVFDEE